MTYPRFLNLKRFICFYDVWAKNPNKDPTFKINHFIDTIVKKS